MRALLNFVVGWMLWKFIRNEVRRVVVIGLGIFLVAYLGSEIEKIFFLKENNNGLVVLIVTKNLAYLALVVAFFTWPFFRKNVVYSSGATPKDLQVAKQGSTDFDGYEFIRRRGRIRRKTEIYDELISANKKRAKREAE